MRDLFEKDRKKIKKIINGFICILSISIFWGIIGVLQLQKKFDYRFYDIMLLLKKAPAERKELLLVDIDDLALDQLGEWPWTRDKIADCLLTMRELGAKTAVFDIEYLSASQKAIDQKVFKQIEENPEKNAHKINQLLKDYDEYFGKTVQFFGNTWLTVNAGFLNIDYSEDDLEYGIRRFLYDGETSADSVITKNYNEFSPAMHSIISKAKGAGFTNVEIDSDGTRRRIKPFIKYPDGLLAQLSIAPLLKIINPEKIQLKKHAVILVNCTIPGEEAKKTIRIPLDKNGNMLINWLKKPFSATKHISENEEVIDKDKTSFEHCSIFFPWKLQQLEKEMYTNLLAINLPEAKKLSADYREILDFKNYILDAMQGYDAEGNAVSGGIEDSVFEEYFAARSKFFEDVYFFAQEHNEASSSTGLLSELFTNIDDYVYYLTEIEPIFNGKFCIIGNTGSGTTDLGSTPFHKSYPNVGTHANVYNTIMTQDFITPVEWYWGFIVAAILSISAFSFHSARRVLVQNLLGTGLFILTLLIPILLMCCGGIYIPVVIPAMLVLSSYMTVTVFRFRASEKDKRFIRETFGSYVAPSYVDLIMKNPEKYTQLGGENAELTALFSDVKTFSGFTEVINNEFGEDQGAPRLVNILNKYLGALSDAILNQNGVVDKYVGDEIVSFFGAPVPSKNNAFDACLAAIRMLQAEKEFNEKYKDELPVNPRTGEPFYLHSRVGLNTGRMVWGNMGTEGKKNLTVMGNNVNLASRLEGTNKIYGSWIMCSESTWQAANAGEFKGKLVARAFDCVRVINVNRPVGIYNILGLRDELPEEQIKAAEIFNKGMTWYMNGSDNPESPKDIEDLKKAYAFFKQADELYPEDESSKTFMKRCANYIKNGVPRIWDGVYTMETK